MSENIYSYHNYLFPFRFDYIIEPFKDKHAYYNNKRFDDRTRIDGRLKESLERDGWKYQKFSIDSSLDYNEFVYFHDFVKDALFNRSDFKERATSYSFKKCNVGDQSHYKIEIKSGEKSKVYDLKLLSIKLHLFDTGVGILSFEMENTHYDSLEDIFAINDYGRRIYPQFLGKGFDLKAPQGSFLPLSIEANGIREDFAYDYRKGIHLARFITETLGETFTTSKDQKGKYYLQAILDDRMFVLSHLLNSGLSAAVKKELNDHWYEYVFVDPYNGKTINNPAMQQKLLEEVSYRRWQGAGTLFGITRYSFVLLTNRAWFPRNILLKHMKSIYLQMVILSLVQRASILRFSDEVTAISDIKPDNNTTQNISNLYKNYLRFKNKLYFKELTAQEQGIELYDMMRKAMRIDGDISDLSNEIHSLNSYANVLSEQEEKEQMNTLTKLGTIFLPGTFIAGFFGMNVFPEHWIDNPTGLILSITLIVCLTWYLSKVHDIDIKSFFIKKKDKNDE